MFRAFKVRKLELTDHKKLPSVAISKSNQPYHFKPVKEEAKFKKIADYTDSLIRNTETAAFLIIRNDSLIYEKYFMGFHEYSILPSNSMAKSFIGTLVGIALQEKAIKSELEPITTYLPELAEKDLRFNKITIRHLLDMRSGLDFKEYPYNLKSDAVKLGFRPNLAKHILKTAKIGEPPGKFEYQSINTQLLGLIIERASHKKLQDYLEEKLWHPMGAENNATWNVDSRKRKHVIISAAINATAQDFAKLGRLYVLNGKINNKQIINAEWIKTVANIDTMEKFDGYKNQWWNKRVSQPFNDLAKAQASRRRKKYTRIEKEENGYFLQYRTEAFSAIGFLHQIIYVHPGKKLIIVRLGKTWPDPQHFVEQIYTLGEQL